VALCRYVIPELKTYKLKTIAKHLGISLENHHRAVDDAKATSEVLLKSFDILVSNILILKISPVIATLPELISRSFIGIDSSLIFLPNITFSSIC